MCIASYITYTKPLSLTVHLLPLGQHPQGVYSEQPQSTMMAALPLQPVKGWITEPIHFGGQFRTITGQQPVQPQSEQVAEERSRRKKKLKQIP